MRSPRRTAQTAAALMVGLALVSAMAVFGASLSKSATSSVEQAISAGIRIWAGGRGQLSTAVPGAAAAVPGVTAADPVYRNQFEFKGTLATITGVSAKNLPSTVILRMTAGSPAALANGALLIDSPTATTDHLAVGDTVPVKFAYTGPATMRIGGIYQANALIQSYLVSSAYFLAHFRYALLAILAGLTFPLRPESCVDLSLNVSPCVLAALWLLGMYTLHPICRRREPRMLGCVDGG